MMLGALMRVALRISYQLFWFVALSLLPFSAAFADKRVALVIGNGAYTNVPALSNPRNDATAIASMLKTAGFDPVIRADDNSVVQMKRTLNNFTDEVRDADVAVVFYAGHGIEVNGINYLIPVDATLKRDIDVEDEAISLDRVSRTLERAKLLRLIILDACRDNPFVRSIRRTLASRSVRSGHGEIDEKSLLANTLIAYAQRAGDIAEDGVPGSHNSPFTTALVKHLVTPGLDIELALRRVRDEVLKVTNFRQEPFKYGSLGGTEIALVAGRVNLDDQRQRELERLKLEADRKVQEAEAQVKSAVAAADKAKMQRVEAERIAAISAQRASEADARVDQVRKEALQRVPPLKPSCATPSGNPFRVINVDPNDVLNMRIGPGTHNDVVYAIPADGRSIYKRTCTTSGGAEWCEVAYDCRTGWVNTHFLAPATGGNWPITRAVNATARVVGVASNDKLWIRPGPGDLSSKLGGLAPDTIGIEKLACERVGSAQWCQIRYGSIVGWVNASFLGY